MQLSNDHHHHIKLKQEQKEEENFNIYVLDKAYNSEQEEQELIKRGYMLHISPKRKRGEKEEQEAKITVQHCSNRKKHSAKRWVVERTNSWHNRFRKLLTRYEKKSENYLGLVQLSCCMIIYRKIILG